MPTKPILFSTPMVQAILAGRKTQTRRVIKGLPDNQSGCDLGIIKRSDGLLTGYGFEKIPHQVGDVLWVRETMYFDDVDQSYYYKADYIDKEIKDLFEDLGLKATPSIFMEKQYARIFLEVTNVRVERLRKISLNDVWDEGTPQMPGNNDADGAVGHEDFIYLWDSINSKRGYGWNTNPWVWVYELKVLP